MVPLCDHTSGGRVPEPEPVVYRQQKEDKEKGKTEKEVNKKRKKGDKEKGEKEKKNRP